MATVRTSDWNNRTTLVWLFLCVLTLASWWLGHMHPGGPASASTPITVGVIGFALIKCHLVIGEFMEVRSSPRWLRLAAGSWLGLLGAGILAIYWW